MNNMNRDETGFCHRHPVKEQRVKLDENHVIIDWKDWKMVREMNLNLTCRFCGMNINVGGKHQERKILGMYRNFNWICDACIAEILKKEKTDDK